MSVSVLFLHIECKQLYDRYTSPDLTSMLHDQLSHFPLGMMPYDITFNGFWLSDRAVQLVRQQLLTLTLQLDF